MDHQETNPSKTEDANMHAKQNNNKKKTSIMIVGGHYTVNMLKHVAKKFNAGLHIHCTFVLI